MKQVAAIVTEYRVRSHADNIVTRLIEGYELHWTTVRPSVRVASLYTDQVPANDISRDLASTYGVPIYPTIREALTLGGDSLAVDGVVLVGEHGDYPYNEKGQHLYPRRRFFEETVAVFHESGRVVPVFTDKHLAYNWDDAKWIYDTAEKMGIPFMAGSSMPVTPRVPPMQVPYGAEVEEIVVVAHGGLESYGFHALEIGQCLAERRQGHETGVSRVQCLTGDAFWQALQESDGWSRDLEEAALDVSAHTAGSVRDHYASRFPADKSPNSASARRGGESSEPAILRVEHHDGLRVTVLMLNGYVTQRGAAVRIRGEDTPLAAQFTQARRQPVWHFDHQVDLIERMVLSGQPPYPVERTLLTTGVIDAVMASRHEGGRVMETPYLAISYAPVPPPGYYERSFVPAGWTRTGTLERRAE
ncbi:MAG TPA: hypothetical protein VGW38_01380 [Chloroflexota bacterium]|nr:hypothetical protein [Chloroflexota bacterium]